MQLMAAIARDERGRCLDSAWVRSMPYLEDFDSERAVLKRGKTVEIPGLRLCGPMVAGTGTSLLFLGRPTMAPPPL
jgi:hypothetical protein